MVELSIVEFKNLAKELYRKGDRRPYLLLGPPGIGKTEGMIQLAQELADEMGLKFIEYDEMIADEIMRNREKYFVFLEFRLYECSPEDFIGIPRETNGFVTFKPLRWAQIFATGPGLLNLDEVTNVNRMDLQPLLYKIFERRIGFIKFHKDVIITATGNSPEDSVIATMLPSPVINRVRDFKIRVPSIEEWISYMYRTRGNDWDKRVAMFLARFKQFFLEKPEDIETLDQYATPRAWTSLAEVSHKVNCSDNQFEALVTATVGRKAGQHFITFCRLDVPNPDEIIDEPTIWEKLMVDQRYLAILQISNLLADGIKNDVNSTLRRFSDFIFFLYHNDQEFITLMTMMIPIPERKKFFMKIIGDKEYRPVVKFFTDLFTRVKKLEEGDRYGYQ